jgi:hypothetical protein
MPTTLPQNPADLMRALNFSEADLQANRDGYMTPAQRRRLARWQHPIYLLGLLLLPSVVVVGWLMNLGLAFRHGSVTPVVLVTNFMVASLVAYGAIPVAARALLRQHAQYQRIRIDLTNNQVLQITGILQMHRTPASDPESSYFVEMGGRTFKVSAHAYALLEDNTPYTLYFLPNTMRLLAAEGFEEPEIHLN